MTFPEPQRIFLATICNYFHDSGKWPTYGDLDRALMHRTDFDVEDLGRELEPFMYDAPYSPMSGWDPQRATFLNLSALDRCVKEGICPALADDLDAFILAVRLGIEKYLAGADNPQVTESELVDRFGMSDLMLRKVFLLLQASDIFGGSAYREDSPGAHPTWTVTAAPTIRRYRNVTTLEQYLAVRQRLREQYRRSLIGPSQYVSSMGSTSHVASLYGARGDRTRLDMETSPSVSQPAKQYRGADDTSDEPQHGNKEEKGNPMSGFSREAQAVLDYVVRQYEPDRVVQREEVARAVSLDGRDLADALAELGDARLIEGFGNVAHRYAAFHVLPLAWEQVDASVAGFNVQQDMVQVAAAVKEHEEVDRATLLHKTGLSEKRLDIAALVLMAHDHIILVRPGVRGLTFATAIATYKTRLFLKGTGATSRQRSRPTAAQLATERPTGAVPSTVRLVRIVVASPIDVQKERDALKEVVDKLNDGLARHLGLRLDLCRWESSAFPGLHENGPQGQIDRSLRIEEADLAIGIFWKRFGTPVGDAKSGTEHELRRAYEAWKENGSPQVMVYFNQQSYRFKTSDELDQMRAVMDFQGNFPKEGLWWTYPNSRKFPDVVREHLEKFLLQNYGGKNGVGFSALSP